MSLVDDVLSDLRGRIQKTLENMRNDLATVRTGRASLHMLDNVARENEIEAVIRERKHLAVILRDLELGRVYLPVEDRRRYDVTVLDRSCRS